MRTLQDYVVVQSHYGRQIAELRQQQNIVHQKSQQQYYEIEKLKVEQKVKDKKKEELREEINKEVKAIEEKITPVKHRYDIVSSKITILSEEIIGELVVEVKKETKKTKVKKK